MRGSSLVPSTIVKTLVCVDEMLDFDMAGRLYNIYMPEPVKFLSSLEFVRAMDVFFDEVAFPQSNYSTRAFIQKKQNSIAQKKEVRQSMSEDVFVNEQGKKASFMIQVHFRQNATWQGTITWMDEKKTQRFRSTLEMIKLMDSALTEDPFAGNTASGQTWE